MKLFNKGIAILDSAAFLRNMLSHDSLPVNKEFV